MGCASVSGEAWHKLMFGFMEEQDDNNTVLAYFLLAFVMGHIVMMNLFLGIIATCFSEARDDLIVEYRHALMELRYPPPVIGESADKAVSRKEVRDEERPPSPRWPHDVVNARRGPRKTTARDM